MRDAGSGPEAVPAQAEIASGRVESSRVELEQLKGERDQLIDRHILARGDEVWIYYYKDDLAAKVAARPDIFKKVK